MRIIIANKFYYNRGGDCICSIELQKLLQQNGHEVAFFSMNYPDNFSSEYASYFAPSVDFSSPGFLPKLKAASRLFSPTDVRIRFEKLIDDFHPDIIHLNNIHSYLSPVLAKIGRERNIKVVWTLHDYKLICPTYSCLRDGHPCELCFHQKFPVLLNRCMKNSLPASVLAFLEAIYWNRRRVEKYVDTFICPSCFMKEKMMQAGFDKKRMVVMNNFMPDDKVAPVKPVLSANPNQFCYVGRLSEEKNIEAVLETVAELPYQLVIIGDGPLRKSLEDKYQSDKIKFLGHRSYNEFQRIVQESAFTVIPSKWYENNPMSVIESLCMGTPVLGADMGGIPELLNDSNGRLFDVNDHLSLKSMIQEMFHLSFNREQIAADAQLRFGAKRYYEKMISLYKER